jgi:hypothetical protein
VKDHYGSRRRFGGLSVEAVGGLAVLDSKMRKAMNEWEKNQFTKNFPARPPYDAAFSNRSQAVLSSSNAAGATLDMGLCVTTEESITYRTKV